MNAAAFDAKGYVDSLPGRPGVYRMLDAQGEILYVGKARNLKSRVGSYFQPSNVQPKVQALVAKTASMEVTITNSDTEALLLEFNLIKKHRPWCCATTRPFPTYTSKPSTNFRA
jgi:excinuclease ABC subunit C